MANVLYVVWWEGNRRNALIDNQVYRLLEHITRSSDHRITLLSGGAFWRGTLLRLFNGITSRFGVGIHRRDTYLDRDQLQERLNHNGVDCAFRNTVANPASIYLSWWRLALFSLPHLWYFHRLTQRMKVDIVHCRSYSPTWLALLSRACFRGRYKIIFDTRGLVPEEGVATGSMREGGLTYRLWRRVERRLLSRVDAVVNVSETFTEHLQQQGCSTPMFTIYASVDWAAFTAPRKTVSDEMVRTLSNLRNGPMLVYLGSIAQTSWHSPEYLARLFVLFKKRFVGARLFVITSVNRETIRALLEAEGVHPGELVVESAGRIEDVAACLECATYAAMPYRQIRGECDRRIAHTMIAAKMGEYLAAGLPVLCNRSIGGAGRIIEKYRVGSLVDLDNPDRVDIAPWTDPAADPEVRERCRATKDLFCMNRNAEMYAGVYNELMAV